MRKTTTIEVVDFEQVLEVPNCLSPLRVAHEMDFLILVPATRDSIRVSKNLTPLNSSQIARLVVVFPVFRIEVILSINLFS
jgi:hypothetical protein